MTVDLEWLKHVIASGEYSNDDEMLIFADIVSDMVSELEVLRNLAMAADAWELEPIVGATVEAQDALTAAVVAWRFHMNDKAKRR